MTVRFAGPLLSSALLGLAGCAGFYEPLEELTGHDNPLVSVPSTIGAVAAGAVGVPIAVLALPVTIPIGVANDANLAPLAPVFAVAQVGSVVVGGLPWLAFGWIS